MRALFFTDVNSSPRQADSTDGRTARKARVCAQHEEHVWTDSTDWKDAHHGQDRMTGRKADGFSLECLWKFWLSRFFQCLLSTLGSKIELKLATCFFLEFLKREGSFVKNWTNVEKCLQTKRQFFFKTVKKSALKDACSFFHRCE